MTLVIGLMCESKPSNNLAVPDSSTLLLCADTMATYTAAVPFIYGATPVASNQFHGKIYPLPHGFYAAFCDDYHWSHQIANELYGRMAKLNPASLGIRDEIKVEIENSFEYAFLWLRPEVLRNEIGIVLDEYLKGTLDPILREDAKAALQQAAQGIPAELIVAGQTPRGPLLLRANASEIREATEFVISGAPSESAINWFKLRGQECTFSVQRSFFHMLEAKRFCELDPSVSRNTQFVIIPPSGKPQELLDRGTLSENWRAEFGLRDTLKLDDSGHRMSFSTAFNIVL